MTRLVGVLLVAILWSPRASTQTLPLSVDTWGPSSEGLRIGIASGSPAVVSSVPTFVVVIQNTGTDRVVNLGSMLASGRNMYATAVGLMLTDSNGTRHELALRGPAIVAGRIDDLVVALPAGASYALTVSLDDYWNPVRQEFKVSLAPGSYQVAARFDGRGALSLNGDTSGIARLNFWKGRVESRPLRFEIPGQ